MEGARLALGFNALQIGVAIMFLSAGTPKLLGSWRMRAMFDHLGVPQQLLVVVGTVEAAAGIGLLVGFHNHAISVFSALVACPFMFGAMMTNILRSRRRDAWLTTGLLLFLCVLIAYVRWGTGGAAQSSFSLTGGLLLFLCVLIAYVRWGTGGAV